MKFKTLLKITNLLFVKKISFKSPKQHNLVIYDIKTLNDVKIFFHRYEYFILETRLNILEKIYISPKILLKMVKNFGLGNIFTVYLISLLEVIKPKVVITRIDNSIKFSEIAKICEKKYKFVAIQAAARFDYIYHNHLFERRMVDKNNNSKIYLPHFFCFGDYEKETFKKLNINVKNFYPIGDLHWSSFLEYLKKNSHIKERKKKDICFITDYIAAGNEGYDIYNHAYLSYNSEILKKLNDDKLQANIYIKDGIISLIKYVLKFSRKHNMSLDIPLKRDNKTNPELALSERNFFKKILSEKDYNFFQENVTERDRENYSSFTSLLNSNVAVGWTSTLLRNKIGIGGKALSCNLTRDELHSFPLKGICRLDYCTYDEFEKRLLKIIQISEKEFQSELEKEPGYIMKFNPDITTGEILFKKLSEFGVYTKIN